MKKTTLTISFLTLLLGASTLISCGGSNFDLILSDTFDTAYIGQVYNFEEYITKQDGVEYSIEAYYQNYYEKKEYSIPVSGLTFIPTEQFEVTVVTTAKKGSEQIKKTVTIPTKLKGDPLDELLATGGFSGWADNGWRKELTNIPQYLHDNDTNNLHSATSLLCSYNGTDPFTWGASVLCLDNFRNLEYWTDKTWENAIISCWVYNPTEYDIEFQLRIKDELKDGKVDWDFGQEGNISCFAEKAVDGVAKWSRLIFPLKKLGIDHTLYLNEDGTRHDSIVIKSKYLGPAEEGVYKYQYYVDGIDVVPHDFNDFYKSIDTRVPDPEENIVLKEWSDYGLNKQANFKDKEGDVPEMVIKGDSSIRYEFDYAEAAKYIDPAYNFGAAAINLNNADLYEIFTAQGDDFENAVLTVKIYNTSDADLEFAMRAVDKEQGVDFDWGSDSDVYKHFVAHPGEWTTLKFNLKDVGITKPIIRGSSANPKEMNVKVKYLGDRETPGYTFSFFADAIDIIKAEE